MFIKHIFGLDVLLACVPLSLGLALRHASPVWVFISSALAVIPLAGWMGRATEHLADRAGAGIGSLLNASFGNAAELIIGLFAIRAGLYDVAKASLTGSIIGNILLVLGMSILAGGIRYSRQTFQRSAACMASTLMALGAIGLVVPALDHYIVYHADRGHEPRLSLVICAILFATYALNLVFSLVTHRAIYREEDPAAAGEAAEPPWSIGRSIAVLVAATGLIALMSALLVGTVETASHRLGLNQVFVGVIVVAIVGNAAEHSTAILMAWQNRMGLSLQIAMNSGLQISLFVAPLLVFASYRIGRPGKGGMDLIFSPLEVAAIGMAVLVVNMVTQDGESNWLEGALLLAVYLILGLAFFYLPAGRNF